MFSEYPCFIHSSHSVCRTVFEEYGPPANIVSLGIQQFRRNWDAIQGEYKDEADIGKCPLVSVVADTLTS
jgi:hypothetical protein